MKIPSKLFRNKAGNHFISLDIGSEVVKALIVRLDKKDEKAFIVGVGERNQKNKNILSENNFQNIISACTGAIDDAVEISKIRPKKIIIGMNGNFIKGISTKTSHKREAGKDKLSEREIKHIFSEIRENLHKNIKTIIKNKEDAISDIDITFSSITSINIDGYRVMNLVGFKGDDIEFTIFSSFMKQSYYQFLKNISKELNLELLEIVSQPYAVSIAMGMNNLLKTNIILVDIQEKMTCVSVIHKGTIEGTKTFDIGRESLVRNLTNKEVNNLSRIGYNYKILLDGIELSLEDFKNIDFFNFKILFYGEGIESFEKNKDTITKLLEERPFPLSKMKIDFINFRDILKIEDRTGRIKDSQYVNSLSLANFILDKKIEENQYNRILNTTIIK